MTSSPRRSEILPAMSLLAAVLATGLFLMSACAPEDHAAGVPPGGMQLSFVASGLCVTGVDDAEEVGSVKVVAGVKAEDLKFRQFGDALLITYSWSAGREYSVRIGGAGRFEEPVEITATAPRNPGPALLRTIALGAYLGADRPEDKIEPSAAAISDDGRWCALGTDNGRLFIFDLRSGDLVARSYSAGAYIRYLAFGNSGERTILYAGEQSPRGTITAYRLGPDGSLRKLWFYETGGDIGTSARDPDDPYSWAHLPGIYRILPGRGALLALAVHPAAGRKPKLSVLYRLDAEDGRVLWRYPDSEPLSAVATWFDSDSERRLVAVCGYDQENGEGVLLLVDGGSGRLLARRTVQPLRPHIEKVNFWRSVSVSPGGKRVGVIADDGRAWLWVEDDGRAGGDWEMRRLVLGKPLKAGGLPLLISGAAVSAWPDITVFATGITYLPWQATAGRQPKQPHPDALKLVAYGSDGGQRWAASTPNLTQGLASDPLYRWLFVGYASDPVFSPSGGSGLAVFDPGRPEAPLLASYPVRGGILMGTPLVADGGRLLALVETSLRDPGGKHIIGSDTIHLLCW